MDDIKIMLSEKNYGAKKDIKVDKIINTITTQTISIEELAQKLISGHVMRPGILKDGNSSANWVGQQIFALDIDNDVSEEDVKTDVLRRISIEDAYTYFKELNIVPIFIYKSYSYDEAEDKIKFRVVFCADKFIEDRDKRNKLQATLMGLLFEKANVDRRCKDASRLFYGTNKHEVMYADYDARINADEIISAYYKDTYSCFMANTSTYKKSNNQKPAKPVKVTDRYCKNVELIQLRDIKSLQEELMIVDIEDEKDEVVNSFDEYIDMSELLGIDDPLVNFSCIFHTDNNPSARILQKGAFKKEDGTEYYKDKYICYSSQCDEKTLYVTQVIEKLLDCSRYEAMKFLNKVYRITTKEFEIMKQQEEILQNKLKYFKDNISKYNSIAKVLSKRNLYKVIIAIIEFMISKSNANQRTVNDSMVVRVSINELNKYLSKKGVISESNNPEKISKMISYLCFLGFINKCSLDDISEYTKAFYDNARKKDKENEESNTKESDKKIKRNEMLILMIPDYNDELFSDISEMSRFIIQYRFKATAISQRCVAALTGNEASLKQLYPEYDKKTLKYLEISTIYNEYKLILNKIKNEIKEKGYMLKTDVDVYLKKEDDYNCMLPLLLKEKIEIRNVDNYIKSIYPELRELKGSNSCIFR